MDPVASACYILNDAVTEHVHRCTNPRGTKSPVLSDTPFLKGYDITSGFSDLLQRRSDFLRSAPTASLTRRRNLPAPDVPKAQQDISIEWALQSMLQLLTSPDLPQAELQRCMDILGALLRGVPVPALASQKVLAKQIIQILVSRPPPDMTLVLSIALHSGSPTVLATAIQSGLPYAELDVDIRPLLESLYTQSKSMSPVDIILPSMVMDTFAHVWNRPGDGPLAFSASTIRMLKLEFPPFSSIAVSNGFAYIHNSSRGLLKVGTGDYNTIRGTVYAENPEFNLGRRCWLVFLNDELYCRTSVHLESRDILASELDTETLTFVSPECDLRYPIPPGMMATDLISPSKSGDTLCVTLVPTPTRYDCALRLGICSFVATESKFAIQKWFTCRTCSSKNNVGCCVSCAQVCHRGHDLVLGKNVPSKFFCDCGLGELSDISCKCCFKRDSEPKKGQNPTLLVLSHSEGELKLQQSITSSCLALDKELSLVYGTHKSIHVLKSTPDHINCFETSIDTGRTLSMKISSWKDLDFSEASIGFDHGTGSVWMYHPSCFELRRFDPTSFPAPMPVIESATVANAIPDICNVFKHVLVSARTSAANKTHWAAISRPEAISASCALIDLHSRLDERSNLEGPVLGLLTEMFVWCWTKDGNRKDTALTSVCTTKLSSSSVLLRRAICIGVDVVLNSKNTLACLQFFCNALDVSDDCSLNHIFASQLFKQGVWSKMKLWHSTELKALQVFVYKLFKRTLTDLTSDSKDFYLSTASKMLCLVHCRILRVRDLVTNWYLNSLLDFSNAAIESNHGRVPYVVDVLITCLVAIIDTSSTEYLSLDFSSLDRIILPLCLLWKKTIAQATGLVSQSVAPTTNRTSHTIESPHPMNLPYPQMPLLLKFQGPDSIILCFDEKCKSSKKLGKLKCSGSSLDSFGTMGRDKVWPKEPLVIAGSQLLIKWESPVKSLAKSFSIQAISPANDDEWGYASVNYPVTWCKDTLSRPATLCYGIANTLAHTLTGCLSSVDWPDEFKRVVGIFDNHGLVLGSLAEPTSVESKTPERCLVGKPFIPHDLIEKMQMIELPVFRTLSTLSGSDDHVNIWKHVYSVQRWLIEQQRLRTVWSDLRNDPTSKNTSSIDKDDLISIVSRFGVLDENEGIELLKKEDCTFETLSAAMESASESGERELPDDFKALLQRCSLLQKVHFNEDVTEPLVKAVHLLCNNSLSDIEISVLTPLHCHFTQQLAVLDKASEHLVDCISELGESHAMAVRIMFAHISQSTVDVSLYASTWRVMDYPASSAIKCLLGLLALPSLDEISKVLCLRFCMSIRFPTHPLKDIEHFDIANYLIDLLAKLAPLCTGTDASFFLKCWDWCFSQVEKVFTLFAQDPDSSKMFESTLLILLGFLEEGFMQEDLSQRVLSLLFRHRNHRLLASQDTRNKYSLTTALLRLFKYGHFAIRQTALKFIQFCKPTDTEVLQLLKVLDVESSVINTNVLENAPIRIVSQDQRVYSVVVSLHDGLDSTQFVEGRYFNAFHNPRLKALLVGLSHAAWLRGVEESLLSNGRAVTMTGSLEHCIEFSSVLAEKRCSSSITEQVGGPIHRNLILNQNSPISIQPGLELISELTHFVQGLPSEQIIRVVSFVLNSFIADTPGEQSRNQLFLVLSVLSDQFVQILYPGCQVLVDGTVSTLVDVDYVHKTARIESSDVEESVRLADLKHISTNPIILTADLASLLVKSLVRLKSTGGDPIYLICRTLVLSIFWTAVETGSTPLTLEVQEELLMDVGGNVESAELGVSIPGSIKTLRKCLWAYMRCSQDEETLKVWHMEASGSLSDCEPHGLPTQFDIHSAPNVFFVGSPCVVQFTPSQSSVGALDPALTRVDNVVVSCNHCIPYETSSNFYFEAKLILYPQRLSEIGLGFRSQSNDYFVLTSGRAWSMVRKRFNRVTLAVGMYVDVRDTAQHPARWEACRVVEVTDLKVKVSWLNWPSPEFATWVERASDDLAPYLSHAKGSVPLDDIKDFTEFDDDITFLEGDVIGLGFDAVAKHIYLTHNGIMLYPVFKDIELDEFVPCVELFGPRTRLEVNFGQNDFLYPLSGLECSVERQEYQDILSKFHDKKQQAEALKVMEKEQLKAIKEALNSERVASAMEIVAMGIFPGCSEDAIMKALEKHGDSLERTVNWAFEQMDPVTAIQSLSQEEPGIGDFEEQKSDRLSEAQHVNEVKWKPLHEFTEPVTLITRPVIGFGDEGLSDISSLVTEYQSEELKNWLGLVKSSLKRARLDSASIDRLMERLEQDSGDVVALLQAREVMPNLPNAPPKTKSTKTALESVTLEHLSIGERVFLPESIQETLTSKKMWTPAMECILNCTGRVLAVDTESLPPSVLVSVESILHSTRWDFWLPVTCLKKLSSEAADLAIFHPSLPDEMEIQLKKMVGAYSSLLFTKLSPTTSLSPRVYSVCEQMPMPNVACQINDLVDGLIMCSSEESYVCTLDEGTLVSREFSLDTTSIVVSVISYPSIKAGHALCSVHSNSSLDRVMCAGFSSNVYVQGRRVSVRSICTYPLSVVIYPVSFHFNALKTCLKQPNIPAMLVLDTMSTLLVVDVVPEPVKCYFLRHLVDMLDIESCEVPMFSEFSMTTQYNLNMILQSFKSQHSFTDAVLASEYQQRMFDFLRVLWGRFQFPIDHPALSELFSIVGACISAPVLSYLGSIESLSLPANWSLASEVLLVSRLPVVAQGETLAEFDFSESLGSLAESVGLDENSYDFILEGVAHLQILNSTVGRLFGWIIGTNSNSQTAAIKCKGLLFPETKTLLFRKVLDLTSSPEEFIRTPFPVLVNRVSATHAKTLDDTVFEQVFKQVESVDSTQLRTPFTDAQNQRPLLVRLQGEQVVGSDGPYRSLFSDVSSEVQASIVSLFVSSPNNESGVGLGQDLFIVKTGSTNHSKLMRFRFLGRMIGVAIRSSIIMSLDLPTIVWKHILGLPTTLNDLEEVDHNLVHGIIEPLRTCTDPSAFEVLFQDVFRFVIVHTDGTESVLIPGGDSKYVEFVNRLDYVDLLVQAKLAEGCVELAYLSEGLFELIPKASLSLFDYTELERLVCGERELDLSVLKRHTEYGSGLEENHEFVRWFWSSLDRFSNDDRLLFLEFTYAQRRLPSDEDFSRLRIRMLLSWIDVDSPDDTYPSSDTCFFNLKLPKYSSENVLHDKLLGAIKMGSGFGTKEEQQQFQNVN